MQRRRRLRTAPDCANPGIPWGATGGLSASARAGELPVAHRSIPGVGGAVLGTHNGRFIASPLFENAGGARRERRLRPKAALPRGREDPLQRRPTGHRHPIEIQARRVLTATRGTEKARVRGGRQRTGSDRTPSVRNPNSGGRPDTFPLAAPWGASISAAPVPQRARQTTAPSARIPSAPLPRAPVAQACAVAIIDPAGSPRWNTRTSNPVGRLRAAADG